MQERQTNLFSNIHQLQHQIHKDQRGTDSGIQHNNINCQWCKLLNVNQWFFFKSGQIWQHLFLMLILMKHKRTWSRIFFSILSFCCIGILFFNCISNPSNNFINCNSIRTWSLSSSFIWIWTRITNNNFNISLKIALPQAFIFITYCVGYSIKPIISFANKIYVT